MLKALALIAEDAGKEILKIYQQDNFEIQSKSDHSPITQAD
jgi:3'-phosphoadenosine 5'-phosphosulfate (PAPS) 3'-phosphatase